MVERLAERSNAIAFNDKHTNALVEIQFFSSFYSQISEGVLLDKILPAAELICNRDSSFIGSLVFIVNQLSFKISLNASKRLI